ncbi:MAG: ATP-binding protein [Verrucomicrobiales bacterium]|nr:ATP-binding protein [Verrucomicrobiales bacterium]
MSDSENPHHLGGILDEAPCGFLRFQDDGTVLRSNTTLQIMLGFAAEEIEGKPISTLLPPAAQVFFQTHLFPTLRMHGAVKELYLSLRDKSGASKQVLVNAVRHDRDGEVLNDCIIVEIVERARFEEALLQAKREAELANELKEKTLSELNIAMESLARAKEEADASSRAKDDFLAALSHELRTPLTPVLLTASILAEDKSLAPELHQQMLMMKRNIELEVALIDDLLDVNRIRHGKLILQKLPIDLHEVLRQTVEIVSSDCEEKNISLTLDLVATGHYVKGDSARLGQVIWNLVKNAIKFTPKDGAIVISTENHADDRITVSVSDTGVGIPGQFLSSIFNRFEQGRVTGQRRFGGLGLGLSISKAIVTAHKGEIWAESDGEGCGSKFLFSLDLIDQPRKKSPGKRRRSVNTESTRILLVEDHETTRLVVSRKLVELGHEVTCAGTIKEAEAAFEAGDFDLLVSDIGLPDGDGLDLMKTIRMSSDIPAIALSGYGMGDDIQRFEEAGFTTNLVKPIQLDQLLIKISEHCGSGSAD